jgi:hypothetical protein
MDRLTLTMKAGLVWSIIFFLIGCAQFQEMVNPQKASENQKINPNNN